ncbi:hypothetical protein WJX72_010801 [[Myrmecia] bisecta]|uniref:Uncharacterized protein n=1 Tax=[Myrmecia] bisecta TaxID=41462 RepID=A0AAW1PAU6_9CHLO
MAYNGDALVLPAGTQPDGITNCYKIWDADRIKAVRSWETGTYKSHNARIIASTGISSGGTGKSTTAATLASGLAGHGHNANPVFFSARSVPGMLHHFMEQAAYVYGARFVLVDLGPVRPHNQYLAMLAANDAITTRLMPALAQHGMQQPLAQQIAQEVAQVLSNTGIAAPGPTAGVAGVVREYDQLKYMTERESIPVPFLQRWHFLTLEGAAYEEYEQQRQLDPNAAMPPVTTMLKPAGKQTELEQKVLTIRRMFSVLRRAVLVVPVPQGLQGLH